MHARLTAGFQESYPYAGIMIGRTNALLVEVQPCSDPLVGHSEKGFGLAFRKVCQGPEGQRHYDLISLTVCASAVRNSFALGARALPRSDTGRGWRRWRNVGRVWRGCGGFRPLPASTWAKLAPARRLVLPGWLSGVARALAAGIGRQVKARPKPSSELPDKIAHPDLQGVGDDLKGIERHALASILQPVEMNAIQAGEFGKLILRDPFLRAQPPDSFPNCPVDVLQPLRLRVYASRKHPA